MAPRACPNLGRAGQRDLGRRPLRKPFPRRLLDGAELRSGVGPCLHWDVGQAIDTVARPPPGAAQSPRPYEHSTVALNVDTGEPAWDYSHLSDRTDFLHSFERILVDTAVTPDPSQVSWINPRLRPGEPRSVLTGIPGETGVVYTLDRETGEFLWATPTVDQNVITSIDGPTGAVTATREDVFFALGPDPFTCHGAKAWEAGAYSPLTNTMYMPLRDSCAQPLAPATLHTSLAPPPDQPNTVRAISVETGETVWLYEQAAAAMSLVATGGGLLFGGDVDGGFMAWDQHTGDLLWRTNLGAPVTGSPITYAVDGQQYIAVSTGRHSATSASNTLPADERSNNDYNLFVFAFPDKDTPRPTSVYNATFSPRGNTTDALLHGVDTTVRFDVGPPDSENSIPHEDWTVNPELLIGDVTPLSVTMFCGVCSDNQLQKEPITYYPSTGMSSEAVFSIRPDSAAVGAGGHGKILFDVWGDGHLYDRIELTVQVVNGKSAHRGTNAASPHNPYTTPLSRASPPPVDLLLTVEGTANAVLFSFEPRGQLKHLSHINADHPGFRKFVLKLSDDDIERLAQRTHYEITSSPIKYGERALATYRSVGNRIFRRLFGSRAEPDLRKFIQTLASYVPSNRPVRIQIYPVNFHIPWKLICPPDTYANGTFWGLTFELGIMPYSNPSSTPSRSTLPGPLQHAGLGAPSDPVAFLGYRHTTSEVSSPTDTAS